MRPAEHTIDSVCERLARHHPEGEPMVRRAYEVAATADVALAAESLSAAALLAELRLDPPAIAAALLEGAGLAPAALRERFGEDTEALVEGVRRVTTMAWDREGGEVAENLRKMFMAIAADVRVVIVALALRLRDMRSLRARPLIYPSWR